MILHVVPLDDWLAAADRPYAPPSLPVEGFVRCCPDEEAALAVADAFHRGAAGPLVVLLVDEEVLGVPVRWEPAGDGAPPGVAADVLFPRVYGPVDRAAVAGMLEVERDADGRAVALALWG